MSGHPIRAERSFRLLVETPTDGRSRSFLLQTGYAQIETIVGSLS
jgi:hypothetical protein